jgi:hypothetical protein
MMIGVLIAFDLEEILLSFLAFTHEYLVAQSFVGRLVGRSCCFACFRDTTSRILFGRDLCIISGYLR